jgi:hypothetical protein
MTYANGRIPDSQLAVIPGTGQRILAVLIPQTVALRSAFAARFGKSLVVTDGYRDYAAQVRVRAQKGKYAAIPGTSIHGWGRALDLGSGVQIDGSPEYRWMRDNAGRFGFTNPAWAIDWDPANGQHEPWHFEAPEIPVPVSNYQATTPAVIDVPTIPTPAPLTPITTVQEDDDMTHIIFARGGFWLKDGARIDGLDAPSLEEYRAKCFKDGTRRYPEVTVTDAIFDGMRVDTSPVPPLVRSPGSGVGLLGGAGGFTGLADQEDVNRFRAAGAREIAVTDKDFLRLSTPDA